VDRKLSRLTKALDCIQYPTILRSASGLPFLSLSQEAFMHCQGAGSLPWLRSALVRAVVLFTLCLPGLLLAQVSTTGKITGVVTDSSGAVVPNATVEVTSPAMMAARTAHTHSDGSYLFDLLPPGSYQVKVTANGFNTLERTDIGITAGFTATVNCKLQVGEVQQTVVVQGEPVVGVQSVQVQTTFDQNLLQQIPSGRDPWSTVAQMPGAT
jgi:hypothetical protein